MKINKKAFGLIALVSATAILVSCSSGRGFFHKGPKKDCSSIFEENAKVERENPEEVTECKVLPLQFSKDIKCEMTGSDSVDDVLKIYSKDNKKTILIAPLKNLKVEEMLTVKQKVILYFVKQKIHSHIDSDLFNDVKDFRYQGVKCNVAGSNIVAWFGDNTIIASADNLKFLESSQAAIEDVKKAAAKAVSNTSSATKAVKKKN